MSRRSILASLALLAAFLVPAYAHASVPAYFRYPDIHGDQIVFSAESDLWIVSDKGGPARRLTSHPGDEHFPHFSPDGTQIAFSGEYDGNVDVYVISAEGGIPRRLTWHPGVDDVVGWTPDGTSVLFRSGRAQPNGASQIWSVPVKGGDEQVLPIGYASRLNVDPATGQWAFTRSSQETSTWKRYRGGTASQIWVGSPGKADFRQVTDFEGSNAFPMWHGGRIYYTCDRGGTADLWSMRPDGSDQQRLTHFKDWDARWPSMGADGRIVFTVAADVHVYDPSTQTEHKVDIDLPGERTLTRSRYPDAADNLSYLDLSPDGDRVVVTTRGEIFSVPSKKGITLPVSRGTGARESWASFSADGKQVLYVTDEPREQEIRIRDAWGRGEPKVVKKAGTSGWYYAPKMSPDGKWVAYSDNTHTLWMSATAGGTPVKVDVCKDHPIREYEWSPDGRWIAYTKGRSTDYGDICVYDTKGGAVHELSSPASDDFSPAWDPDGRYLYFLSNRSVNPILGTMDWDNVEAKNTRPYVMLLRKDVKNPLADLEGLPDDAAKSPADSKDKKDASSKKKSGDKGDDAGKGKKPVEIDFDGIQDRVVMFDVPIGQYSSLSATSDHVFYLSNPVKGFAEVPGLFQEPKPDGTLIFFDLDKKKAKTFTDGVDGYVIASGGKKIAITKDKGEIYVTDTSSAPDDLSDSKVNLSDAVIDLDPHEEWAQIYYEAWRNERDFFWDPAMGGLDWKRIGDQYATLLPRLASRSDLKDLLGQLLGELNNSHTYTFGGDPGVDVDHVSVGLLGADVKREGSAYRVERIYRGDPADNVVSPLRAPGADVKEGEYILAVNHRPFEPNQSFYSLFADRAGKSVVLTVNSKNSTSGQRDVIVKTIPGEGELRYVDWVRTNREYVAKKTNGRVGYVHLPDMWQNGLIQFNRWFYPQLDKEAMVIDARWNGGGAVSQMMIERLARHVVSFDRTRLNGISTYPQRVINGPFVVLTNEFAGSDGDIFPAVIQREKLAPVIGKRTWGGVVGINGERHLVDGSLATEPEGAWWEPKGGWTIENHGVDPDIVVENMPQDVAKGVDAQLDRGIQEVLRLRDAHPPIVPVFGPIRQKPREAFAGELSGIKSPSSGDGQTSDHPTDKGSHE